MVKHTTSCAIGRYPRKWNARQFYSCTYSGNGTDDSEGGRNDVEAEADPVVPGNACLESSPVEWGRADSRGAEFFEGSRVAGGDGAGGVFRACCCRRELAVMSTSTSLDKGPDMPTACATAVWVATDTSFTVTCDCTVD